jgi:hypothetical protein
MISWRHVTQWVRLEEGGSMTDIVQQLHDLYRSHPVVMQAADEIERLRARIDAVQSVLRSHHCNLSACTIGECIDNQFCECACLVLVDKLGSSEAAA